MNLITNSRIEAWAVSLGVVALTLIANFGFRAAVGIFRRKSKSERIYILTRLVPSISALILVVGARVFIETAPFHPTFEKWLEDAAYVVIVVILLSVFRQAALVGIEWTSSRAAQSKALQHGFIPLMRNLLTLFVFFAGTIMVMKHFNYDVLSLLTALGVGSLAVGLAAKEALSNMISGFVLIIDRNLLPGDRINLGGAIGDVEEIGLRSTRIRTGDGNILIVPNFDMVNSRIVNLSEPNRNTTATLQFRLPCSVPFNRVKSICLEIFGSIPKILKDKGSWVNLQSLGEGHQLIQAGFWVGEMDDAGAALSEFHERLLDRFSKEGIQLLPPPARN